MKREIKKLSFLLVFMIIFKSSQEKTAASNNYKCTAKATTTKTVICESQPLENEEPELLMPISNFILLH